MQAGAQPYACSFNRLAFRRQLGRMHVLDGQRQQRSTTLTILRPGGRPVTPVHQIDKPAQRQLS